MIGLKMTEVKHCGVKLGLKLSVVGLLLLFRRNRRQRCVAVYFFLPFVLFVCSCLMLGVGL